MLEFLDGVEKTCKKLVLMTCNDLGRVSQYMQDRCSRIRYLRKYTVKDNYEFLPFLLEEYNVLNKEEVTDFITNRMKLPSIDNMLALIKEVKLLENEEYTVEMVAKFMNMEIIGETKLSETPKEKEVENLIQSELETLITESFDFEKDLNWEVEPCCCAA